MYKFKPLHVPEQWRHYWSKYPEGYTILEALLKWVNQVDDISEAINKLGDNWGDFKKEFDGELQNTVSDMFNEWTENGVFESIINDTVLANISTKVDNHITEVETQLADFDRDIKDRMVNVKKPGGGITGAEGTGNDETVAVQNVLDNMVYGETLYIPPDVKFDLKTLNLPDNVNIFYKHGHRYNETVMLLNNQHSSGTPVNEVEISSPYHTGFVLNSYSDLNANVPDRETTLARSIVFRLDDTSQVVMTTYGDGQFLMRHVNAITPSPFGEAVFGVDANDSSFALGQPIRTSTRKGSVSTTKINSRPLYSYSDYFTTNVYIDYESGSDETGDGTQAKPFRTIAAAEYEIIPHTLVCNFNIILLSDYVGNFSLKGLLNMGYNVKLTGNGTPKKIYGTLDLSYIYGNIVFNNIVCMERVNINHVYGAVFDGLDMQGTDFGFIITNSDIQIKNTAFNDNNFGLRADHSKVFVENNTGSTVTNYIFSREGGVVTQSGTQPEGDNRQVLTGQILPGASGYFNTNDGKRVFITNGLVTDITTL